MTPGTARQAAIKQVRDALAGRHLFWFGIRGEDGEALGELPELDGSFAITARMRPEVAEVHVNVCFEELSGFRPDLDDPALDIDTRDGSDEFRRRLLEAVSQPCVVMTYRPTDLTSAMAFAAAPTMTLAGMLTQRQAAFDHKPWVDVALSSRGVRGLGWQYIADERHEQAKALVAERPHVLRTSRTSGGAGIVLARDVGDVDTHWPSQPESFVAVAPFLADALPINLSGCIFDDGSVRLHPPSVQLIGITSCTSREFGYCGNDFAATSSLSGHVIEEIQRLGETVAAWMSEEHYRGAFGIDALVQDDLVYFTEVNPRFQGSSALSALLAREMDIPDLFLDHLAATLGLGPAGDGLTVRDWIREQPPAAQVVVHNASCTGQDARWAIGPPDLAGLEWTQLAPNVVVEPGGTYGRMITRRSVTKTGFSLDEGAERAIAALRHGYEWTAEPHAPETDTFRS